VARLPEFLSSQQQVSLSIVTNVCPSIELGDPTLGIEWTQKNKNLILKNKLGLDAELTGKFRKVN
jgi:hypothetical protein